MPAWSASISQARSPTKYLEEEQEPMTWTNKVIWTEGMFLQPQHFQQHDRYTLSQELQRSNAQQPYGWGFLSLSLDSAALNLGKIAINAAQGLMPDGVAFDIPGQDAAPAALDVPQDTRDELGG